jgi:hypothetical protein
MRRLRTTANKQWTSIKRLILIVGECFFRQSSSGLVVVVFTGPGLVTICRLSGSDQRTSESSINSLINPFGTHPKMLYRAAAISRNVAP